MNYKTIGYATQIIGVITQFILNDKIDNLK